MVKQKAHLAKKSKDSKRKSQQMKELGHSLIVLARCIILFTVVPPPKHNEPVQRRQLFPLTGSNPTYGMSTRLPKIEKRVDRF